MEITEPSREPVTNYLCENGNASRTEEVQSRCPMSNSPLYSTKHSPSKVTYDHETGYALRFGAFRIAASHLGVSSGRARMQMSGLFVGTPTPWQVAARAFVSAQVLGNYALVLRKVTRHSGE